eukprot:6426836-Alexandrium_andersonii.AAC.1
MVEYIEAVFGEELRSRIAAGTMAGGRGEAVQAALADRVVASPEQARLWAAEFWGCSAGAAPCAA